jgi:PKD repeat protein
VLVVIVLILLTAGFLFHVLPAPNNLGHYIEAKATPDKLPILAGASAGLTTRMNLPLIVDFTSAPDTDYSPQTIRFFDMSRGDPGTWQWDFGDGMSSAEQHPVHQYELPGLYNVTLTITRDDGSRRVAAYTDVLGITKPAGQQVRVDTLRQGLLKKGSAVTFLSADSSSFCIFNGVKQIIPGGSIAKLRVNTDDTGQVSIREGNLFSFNFTDATLFVNGIQQAQGVSGDCILPASRYFHANLTYAVLPTEGPIRQVVIDGEVVRSGIENSRILIVHDSADKNADLTLVTYPAFFEGLATNFSISSALIATFDISQTEGPAPLNVTFRDLSAGAPGSWAWDFGDGTRSSEQNPTHQYLSPGSYTVSLTVTKGDQTDSKTLPNAIIALPPRLQADFSATPLAGPVPLKVTFTDLSTNSPSQWYWEFGNATPENSTRQNEVVIYTEKGTYSVLHAVSNVYGSSDVFRPQYITVTDPYRTPDQSIVIKTGKNGYITVDSCFQFVVSDTPATIGINGGYRELPKGATVLIEAQRNQSGEIYMDKGQLLKFSFPDMAVYVNGDLVATGPIDSIYVPHQTGFRTALTYYLPPASAYTKVTQDGFDVLGDLETAWIRVDNLGMDAGGNLRLTSTDNTTYLSGAANQTVHDWVVQ